MSSFGGMMQWWWEILSVNIKHLLNSYENVCHLNLANGWATAKYRSTEMATVENMEPTLQQHILAYTLAYNNHYPTKNWKDTTFSSQFPFFNKHFITLRWSLKTFTKLPLPEVHNKRLPSRCEPRAAWRAAPAWRGCPCRAGWGWAARRGWRRRPGRSEAGPDSRYREEILPGVNNFANQLCTAAS